MIVLIEVATGNFGRAIVSDIKLRVVFLRVAYNFFFIRINIYKTYKYRNDTTGSLELHGNPVAITHK